MWNIRDIKQRAKGLFKANYWKAVLAALILSFVVGGTSSSGGGAGMAPAISSMQTVGMSSSMQDGDMPMPVVLAMVGMVTVVMLIVSAIAILADVFLLNPLEVGIRRYFSVNLFERAQIREIAYGFDHAYKNIVKVMFFRDLYTFLWSLLFIIPGIVKSYEYRMIPYLMAEYPEMTKEDAFAISKYMMSGNKWKTFVLDLSFILWFLGSICTFGLLGMFYGDPYYGQTGAVLYDVLKTEKQPFARGQE